MCNISHLEYSCPRRPAARTPPARLPRTAERGWIKNSHRLKRWEKARRGPTRRLPASQPKKGQHLRCVLVNSNTPPPPAPLGAAAAACTRPYARPPARMHHILICAHVEEAHPEALHRASSSSFPPLIFLFLLSTSISSATSLLCGLSRFNPPRPPRPPSLPPPSALAILVLGGGHGHASLSGLINHPHSWQPASPPGANGFFLFFPPRRRRRKHEFSAALSHVAVVPHDQG